MIQEKVIKKYVRLMDSAVMKEYYGQSGFLNVGYWNSNTHTQAQASEQLVQEIINPIDFIPQNILDVACGMGATTNYIHKQFPLANITGINVSPHQVKICEERWSNLSFKVMDAAQLIFDNESFDAVISVEAAVHFDSRKKFFEEAFRVLKKNGQLVISDLTFSKKLNWITAESNNEANSEDFYKLLKEIGYTNIQIKEVLEETWIPYYKNMLKWGMTKNFKNELSNEDYQEIIMAGKITQKLPITHYLLISAKK
ncbi:MAG: class I SAM-dependent methyltransferase [Flavobacteriales bacterium]